MEAKDHFIKHAKFYIDRLSEEDGIGIKFYYPKRWRWGKKKNPDGTITKTDEKKYGIFLMEDWLYKGCDIDAAWGRINTLDGAPYIHLNPVSDAWHEQKIADGKDPQWCYAKNKDISRRLTLLIDSDPVRDVSPSSSNEHKLAIQHNLKVIDHLKEHYGLKPENYIQLSSGNGCQSHVAINLPCNDETDSQIKTALAFLSSKIKTDGVDFDCRVFERVRVARLAGFRNIKGTETEDRKHRLASIIHSSESYMAFNCSKLFEDAQEWKAEQEKNSPKSIVSAKRAKTIKKSISWDGHESNGSKRIRELEQSLTIGDYLSRYMGIDCPEGVNVDCPFHSVNTPDTFGWEGGVCSCFSSRCSFNGGGNLLHVINAGEGWNITDRKELAHKALEWAEEQGIIEKVDMGERLHEIIKSMGRAFPVGFFDDPDPIPIENKNQEPEDEEEFVPYCSRPEFKALLEKAKRGKQKDVIQEPVKTVYENEFEWDEELTETEPSPPIQKKSLSDSEIEENMQMIKDSQRRAEYRKRRGRLSRRI